MKRFIAILMAVVLAVGMMGTAVAEDRQEKVK